VLLDLWGVALVQTQEILRLIRGLVDSMSSEATSFVSASRATTIAP
jgi:hypothetical protein